MSMCVCVCVCVWVCVCVVAISTVVAVGHGKSSVLPLIVLITSLGAASLHTYWPLSLLWNHALLTRCWWCHQAHRCMMGGGKREDNFRSSIKFKLWRCRFMSICQMYVQGASPTHKSMLSHHLECLKSVYEISLRKTTD